MGLRGLLHHACSHLLFKVKKRGWDSFPNGDTPLPPVFLGTPPPQPRLAGHGHQGSGGSRRGKRVEPGEAKRPSLFSASPGFRSRLSPHASPRTRVSTVLRHLAVLHSVSVSTFPCDRPLEMDVFITLEDKLTAFQAHGFLGTFLRLTQRPVAITELIRRCPLGPRGPGAGVQDSSPLPSEGRKSRYFPPPALKSWVKRVTSQDTGKTQQEIFKCFPKHYSSEKHLCPITTFIIRRTPVA